MSTSETHVRTPPTGFGAKVRQVGPGLLAAATGVGAGDLVATMVAGARFGTVLLWAAVLGTVLKLALAEGVGRWHLASNATMLDGWRRLGYWATVFFGIYIVIWGFVYGATAMSAVGLPLNALFGGLSVRYWAMIAGVVGLVLVWIQRYQVFEKFITVLVAIKFVSVVSVAVLVVARPRRVGERPGAPAARGLHDLRARPDRRRRRHDHDGGLRLLDDRQGLERDRLAVDDAPGQRRRLHHDRHLRDLHARRRARRSCSARTSPRATPAC